MPIAYTIRPDLRLVICSHVGDVADTEFMETYRALLADEAFDLSYHRLIDLRRADSSVRTTDALERISDMIVGRYSGTVAKPRTAIVAPLDISFGLGRMYGAFSGGGAGEVAVFRLAEAALEWLGMPRDVFEG